MLLERDAGPSSPVDLRGLVDRVGQVQGRAMRGQDVTL
jgi:hypothetical protein